MIELNNYQRNYFGLDPIHENWKRVIFPGDRHRPESILFFENNIIKKHIISTNNKYVENQYYEETENFEFLLPKTKKGKMKKLSPSTLESRTPIGVYCRIEDSGRLIIGNHSTQQTFYNSSWDQEIGQKQKIDGIIDKFITTCSLDYLNQIEEFKSKKRKNIKYRTGDFFSFKVSREKIGFGRILLDINKARKQKLIQKGHGLSYIMGPPLLIKIYNVISDKNEIDLNKLKNQKSLPSCYMMDNKIFYDEYRIIGNLKLESNEIEFPISYGKCIGSRNDNIYLQWGLIHKEIPKVKFDKYLKIDDHETQKKIYHNNPFSRLANGFEPKYGPKALNDWTEKSIHPFDRNESWFAKYDLRNPINHKIKKDIMQNFKLDPKKNYHENANKMGFEDINHFIRKINS